MVYIFQFADLLVIISESPPEFAVPPFPFRILVIQIRVLIEKKPPSTSCRQRSRWIFFVLSSTGPSVRLSVGPSVGPSVRTNQKVVKRALWMLVWLGVGAHTSSTILLPRYLFFHLSILRPQSLQHCSSCLPTQTKHLKSHPVKKKKISMTSEFVELLQAT